jgi:hypothetical protein
MGAASRLSVGLMEAHRGKIEFGSEGSRPLRRRRLPTARWVTEMTREGEGYAVTPQIRRPPPGGPAR